MADGDSIFGSAGSTGQFTQQQFTRRRSFLGFKIKSKPVYAQPGQAHPPEAKKPQKAKAPLGLLLSVIIGLASFFALNRLGIGIIEGAAIGAVVFLLLAALVVSMGMGRRKNIPAAAASMQAAPQYRGKTEPAHASAQHADDKKKPSGPLDAYVNSVVKGRKKLEAQMLGAGMKESPQEFVKKMLMYALMISIVVGVAIAVLFFRIGEPLPITLVLSLVLWLAVFEVAFNRFMMYPVRRPKTVGKLVERDVLFAARDIVVGMRSGMPLFNAIASVSTGYGETSKEFARIVELVQLGMPMEQAMDKVSSKSESPTFKRLMLQASVSIKAGVDVTATLQDVVDEAMQERVIDIRRYGQKLNALAMFYMLFGVIFPSMGVAVLTIMSTFISIFPVTYVILLLVLIFIAFIQIVLLNLMRQARPVFIM